MPILEGPAGWGPVGGRSTSSAVAVKQMATMYSTLLNSFSDVRLLASIAGEEAVNVCFEQAFCQNTTLFRPASHTPHCLPECRLALEGNEAITCARHEQIQGTSIREKVAFIGGLKPESYISLVQNNGFLCSTEPGCLVLISTVGDVDSHSLRWSFTAGAEDNNNAAIYAKNFMGAHPSLQLDKSFAKLLQALKSYAA